MNDINYYSAAARMLLLLLPAAALLVLASRRRRSRSSDGSAILSVKEVRFCGPRARLAVVDFHGRRLLIGVAERGMSLLAEGRKEE